MPAHQAALPEVGPATGAERADAFISYSRSDEEFVEGVLLPALVAHGNRIWLDLKDMPPAADWSQRIRAGIEGARAGCSICSVRQNARSGVAFSRDGSVLAAAGEDGVVLWRIFWHRFSDLRSTVCGLVRVNLTETEWAALAPGLPYHATCPD